MEWKLFFFIFLIKVFFFCQQHQQMNCLKSRYLNSGCAYWDFFLSGNACLYSYSDTKVCMKSFCYHSTSHLRLTVSFGSFLILGFFFFFFFFFCGTEDAKIVSGRPWICLFLEKLLFFLLGCYCSVCHLLSPGR